MFDDPEYNDGPRLAPYFFKEQKATPNFNVRAGSPPNRSFNPEKGTTGLALRFKDGIIIAADRRVSAGYYIASTEGKKVHKLTDKIAIAISGLVSDAMSLVELMQAELKIFRFENEYEPTVKVAAYLLSTIMHSGYRRYQPFYAQLLVGGIDQTGPHIYALDPSGAAHEEPYSTIGSGTMLAMGALESDFNKDMSREEAEKLVTKSLKASIGRDLATGDGIDMYIITAEKIEEKKVEIPNKG
ncbi:MAG: proteasome subunit beta [Candidatus Hodarchaeales archaeon]|jgi:proteasome beta subunit